MIDQSKSIQPKLPKNAWLVVFLLFWVGALNYLDRNTIATMRSSIIESISMTDAQFGILTSVFLWTYAFFSPIAGFIADRFSRSKVIIFSFFIWSLVTWLTSYASTYNQLLATRALMGVSEAFYLPAAGALIIDYHRNSTQSIATSIHLTGVTLGSTLGFIGGWLAEKHTWHYAFHVFGILGLVYAIILLFLLKDIPKNSSESNNKNESQEKEAKGNVNFGLAVVDLFKNRSFIYLFLFWGILGIVGWTIMAWLPTFFKEQFNLSQSMAGFYATAFLYPASIVGLLFAGILSDRWSKRNKYARIFVPILGLLIAAHCIFFASYTTILYISIILFMLYGLTRSSVEANFTPIACSIVSLRYRSTGLGILNMIATTVGGFGIYLTGMFRDLEISLKIIYQMVALSIIICVFLLWLIKREQSKKKV